MAEAVAAFYAVETAVEGAAVGAYAASRPTVPLHVQFRKLVIPRDAPNNPHWTPVAGQSLNIVKGKGYLFGGDIAEGSPNACVRVITLPSSLENNEVDIRVIEPEAANERPLQPYSTVDQTADDEKKSARQTEKIPQPRALHASTSIDSNIFIISGRPSHSQNSEKTSNASLYLCENVHCFSTQTGTWSSFEADVGRCADGVPCPRTSASCASTTHPRPGSGVEVTTTAYGTIFLHGGHDETGTLLRDTWSFDVSSRVWKRWPDVPAPDPQEVAGEGKILICGDQICRVGDGFGKVMLMDIDVVEGDVVHAASGPHLAETAVKPKTGQWETKSFGLDPENQAEGTSKSLPVPRNGAGFVSITTGAGRFYNLYFMGQAGPGSALTDIWSLQTKAGGKTPAALKDSLRKAVGKSTGENEWALCEIVESTKTDGPLERPEGLYDFAADSWDDLGGAHAIIWGGRDAEGNLRNEGWMMSAQ